MSINGRRAFASKLIKDSNVDIRHRLAKILASASSSPVVSNDCESIPEPFPSLDRITVHGSNEKERPEHESDESTNCGYYCDTSIADLVDPIDYEEFIAKNSERIPADLRSILLFPADDIVVEKYQPPVRTMELSGPEFDNIDTCDDPYIQHVDACNLKSLIVVKKYEKTINPGETPFRYKKLARQEYEADLKIKIPKNDGSTIISIPQTPNTFYSGQSSVRSTPRPQSLISSSSTTKPPLASDEDDFIEEDDSSSRTPLAQPESTFDNISVDSFCRDDNRNSWAYIDGERRGNSLRAKNLFYVKNVQIDDRIQEILEKKYEQFFNELNLNYDITNRERIHPIFCLHPSQPPEDLIEFRPPVLPPSDVPRFRFLLKCLSLELSFTIEPIFASIAIYDAKARKKVTENFYFDFNSEPMKNLLQSYEYQDLSTLSKAALFSLSHLGPDMYFVIKLEKVFQSDLNDILDAYSRPPEEANKVEKLKKTVKSNCERLGQYRMMFAWAFFPLADVLCNQQSDNEDNESLSTRNSSNSLDSIKRMANDCSSSFVRKGSLERHSTMASNGSVNSLSHANSERKMSITSEDLIQAFSSFQPVTITSKVFYRPDGDKFSDDDLYKFLQEFRRPGNNQPTTQSRLTVHPTNNFLNSKRIRGFPFTLKIDISPVTDMNSIKCCVNPELVKLHPYGGSDEKPISPVKEILEFRDLLIPHVEHRNLLYVYPKSLNFSSRPISARNISIHVKLMCSEDRHNSIPVVFGRSSCPEFEKSAFTAINYHNRSPNFADEIKIRLPSQINKQTHLFFTFAHVHTKPKNHDTSVDEIVGYTWLPLWNGDCLQTGTFQLPIISEYPSAGYSFTTPTDPTALASLKWHDNHKPLFTVHLEAYSSIFAQDPYVDRFFRICSSIGKRTEMISSDNTNLWEEFFQVVNDLTNANVVSLVKFVDKLMNMLIDILVKPPIIIRDESDSFSHKCIKALKNSVFQSIVMLVSKINTALYSSDHEMRMGILNTFVQYQAIIPQPNLEPGKTDIMSDQSEFSAKSLHTEIVHQWVSSDPAICEKIMENSFFFFHLIFKSLCISTSLKCQLQSVPRCPSQSFKNAIYSLVEVLTKYVLKETRKMVAPAADPVSTTFGGPCYYNLNCSFAYFIRDLISLLDRHYVFGLIKMYLMKISCPTPAVSPPDQDGRKSSKASELESRWADELFELKIAFMRIICGHEHIVALNLPFGTPLFAALEQAYQNPNPKFLPSFSLAKEMLDSNIFSNVIFYQIRPFSELTDEYRRQHWLLGLMFCTLLEALTKDKSTLQTRAANLVKSLLSSFDWNKRFQNPKIKQRVACLFLPLIGIMIDIIEKLPDSTTKENPFYSAAESQKHRKMNLKCPREENSYGSTFIETSIAIAIGTSNNGETNGTKESSPLHYRHLLSYKTINQEAGRILMTCFLWVVGNIDHRLFVQYLNEFSNERLLAFLELLRMAMRFFEYRGEKNIRKSTRRQSSQKLEDAIRYGTARRELMRRRDYSLSFGSKDSDDLKVRWKKDSTLTRYHSLDSRKVDCEDEIATESNLCSMMNFIVLDSITMIANIFRQRIKCNTSFTGTPAAISAGFSLKNRYGSDEFVVGSVFHTLLQLLAQRQSTWVLEAAFDVQRALLRHFPELLFTEGLPDVEFCSDICYLLLKHCASQIDAIRAQASASIYLLLKQYYECNENYSRIKIQITMSLSQLVGTSSTFNEINIRNSLNNILWYAIEDQSVVETQFPKQVQELVFNLIMILSNTMQMKEHKNDPETLLDLMYRVAKGYQNSPELRITWLENMAKKHIDMKQLVEAAQCYVHAAALVSECLHKISRRVYLPVSCAAFQKVCPNVFEESLNSNSEINIDRSSFFSEENENKKGVQSVKLNESGLVSLLEQAADHFFSSGMFEAVNEVYKLLIPIHESHYQYSKLAKVHGRLQSVFTKIQQQEGKRVFATFFRVGFYGPLFGDLNQKEFIYKEPFLTKLPEIAYRLEIFYCKLFGQENVEIIKDSNPVNLSKLEPHKAYIQITYVEPYFDSWELESRQTSYERNYNIKRFIYSTPFTMDGRAHGQLYEQCKRKTILTAKNAFPYVKTRIEVTNRQQHSLSPIEVAIEDVQKKTNELANATHQEPVNAKILQMNLQGCVGTTVNQGPGEIAFVFLSDEPNIPTGHQRPSLQLKGKLRDAFKEFCARCGEALSKNRKLINGNEQQMEYHKELERNFRQFTERLAPLMGAADTKKSLALLRKTYINGYGHNSIKAPATNSDGPVTNGVGESKI